MSANGAIASIAPHEAEPPGLAPRLHFIDDQEIQNLPPLTWLVEDIIPEGGLAVLYGQPETGKSFAALALAFSIATGRPFFGRSVHRAPVIYVAAEGSAGLGQRVGAWKQSAERYDRAGVQFLTEPVDLSDLESVSAFASAVRGLPEPPRLIVFDTLARSLVGGDENSSQDVGVLIHHASLLQQKLKVAVLFIHHTRKDGETERGSSALRGAADVMMRCDREKGSQMVTLVCDKAKDAPHFSNLTLELVRVADSCALVTANGSLAVTDLLRAPAAVQALRSLHESAPLNEGLSTSQWCTVSGLPARTFFRERTRLLTWGYVDHPVRKKGAPNLVTPRGHEAFTANCNITA